MNTKNVYLIGCIFFMLTTIGLSVGIAVAVTFPRATESVFFDTGSTQWASNCTTGEWTIFSQTNTLGRNMQYVSRNDASGNFDQIINASFYADNLHTVDECKAVCASTHYNAWAGTCVQFAYISVDGNKGKCYFKDFTVPSYASRDTASDTYGLCRSETTYILIDNYVDGIGQFGGIDSAQTFSNFWTDCTNTTAGAVECFDSWDSGEPNMVGMHVASQADCQTQCEVTTGCHHFAWHTNPAITWNNCHLKDFKPSYMYMTGDNPASTINTCFVCGV